MLPNERFALERRAFYESIGLVVDATNGEFAHCPYPEGMGETGYYLLHDDHQHQGLLQSRDVGQCCFFTGYAKQWLVNCNQLPENYFELWDIYDEYASEHARNAGRKTHEMKNESGKSVQGIKNAEKLHEEKNEEGKSVNALKSHKEKNKEGKSVHAIKAAKKVHEKKNEEGKSLHTLKMSEKVHAKKNENGKSLHALKVHETKDENGKSVQGVKNGKKGGKKVQEEKDENGKSVHGVKNMKKTNSQVWESTMDGFQSNPGTVAKHNKRNGWDPNARVRIK